MGRRATRTVLRCLRKMVAEPGISAFDQKLPGQIVAMRDESAFAELVRRHEEIAALVEPEITGTFTKAKLAMALFSSVCMIAASAGFAAYQAKNENDQLYHESRRICEHIGDVGSVRDIDRMLERLK